MTPAISARLDQQPTFRQPAKFDRRETELFGKHADLVCGAVIVAARALGLDCGPMSGFDNAGVDKAFFSGTRIQSNFICSIGYGDPASVFPRNPRLSFEEAGRWA